MPLLAVEKGHGGGLVAAMVTVSYRRILRASSTGEESVRSVVACTNFVAAKLIFWILNFELLTLVDCLNHSIDGIIYRGV